MGKVSRSSQVKLKQLFIESSPRNRAAGLASNQVLLSKRVARVLQIGWPGMTYLAHLLDNKQQHSLL